MSEIARRKAIAYVLQGDRLLVFRHTEFPQAGIQVPAGTIEPGESPREAVLRETREETGLEALAIRTFLGERDLRLSPGGREGIERRYFFHLEFVGEAPECWLHHELHPSDGSPAPIELEFYWVQFPDEVPELSGGQGAFLSQLAALWCTNVKNERRISAQGH